MTRRKGFIGHSIRHGLNAIGISNNYAVQFPRSPSFHYRPPSTASVVVLPPSVLTSEWKKEMNKALELEYKNLQDKLDDDESDMSKIRIQCRNIVDYIAYNYALYLTKLTGQEWKARNSIMAGSAITVDIHNEVENKSVTQNFHLNKSILSKPDDAPFGVGLVIDESAGPEVGVIRVNNKSHPMKYYYDNSIMRDSSKLFESLERNRFTIYPDVGRRSKV